MSDALDLSKIDKLVELVAGPPAPAKPWKSPSGREYYLIVPHPAAVEEAYRSAHPSRLEAVVRDDGSWSVAVFLGDEESVLVLMGGPDVVANLRGCSIEQLASELGVLLGREKAADDQRQAGPEEGA